MTTARFTARLPLRTRLALLTALAVAVAVAVCALAAWFLVRDQLLRSLDESLRENPVTPGVIRVVLRGGVCESGEAARLPPPDPSGLFEGTTQVIDADGRRCVIAGSAPVEVTGADIDVARGLADASVHDTAAADGVAYRVFTRQLEGTSNAVSVARPLAEVNDPLRSLAVVLALVAAVGAVGAAGVGVALARAGLRPVDRLTDAAEHIARTEDLNVRIPVTGDDEIARLSRSFNAMTQALASSRDLQQQLIADAGHELRTPLTSLRTNIELLARSEQTGRPLPPAERQRLLASVTAQLTELAELIGDLQELSRPETAAGMPGGAPPPVTGLHDIAARAVDRVRLRAEGQPVAAELHPWHVRAEPAALERAVVNLLDNAVKFGRGQGEVTVVLRDGVLCVRDHGPGIAPEELPHVFERFWRSPGARSLPGSGLGLSIVARTVRQCGGDIRLGPAEGGGTVAHLTLPGAPAPPPDDGPAQQYDARPSA